MLVDHGTEILSEADCRELVGGEEVGRVAVSVAALPAIFPVNYKVVDGDVYFLTGDGTKAKAALEGSVVGFEVDHLEPVHRSGWSVLIVGQARIVTGEERAAIGDLGLSPWAGGAKSHLVRIHPEFVSGRRICATPPD